MISIMADILHSDILLMSLRSVTQYVQKAAWKARQTWLHLITVIRQQQAGSLSTLRCTVHELPPSWGFYITAPFSCVWTIFPGSASFGWPTVQFAPVIAFAREGTKAVRVAVVSFCIPYVRSLLHKQCSDCQEDISHYLLWGNSLSERNHNSNDKSCVVSRWIMQC